MSRIRFAGLLFGVALLAVGCADRPNSAELTESIIKATAGNPTVTLTSDEAQCIAAELLATDLSDTTLSGLAEDFNQPDVLAAEQDQVNPAVADATRECVGNG